MRLLALDLERYGAFTGQRLAFRADAPLHIVYGRNEAGKSTALAAVGDLLFGFGKVSAAAFLHGNAELRVGARLAARGGAELAFRRRKGNLRTLIDADDKPLPDDALAPFLGGLTRQVFERAFGLSQQSLRDGGRQMLAEKGDIGATLFAAASGLRAPAELKRGLDAEAERIFDTKRAGHRRFYQALDRLEAARKAMRETELRGGDWKELNARIDALAAELDEVGKQRARCASERTHLERLKRLAPLVALIDARLRDIAELPPVPAVPSGYAERLRAAIAGASEAKRRRSDTAAAVEGLEQERAALVVDEALVARANDITAIHAETGRYTKAMEDLPGVARDAEALRAELADRALRLGLADWQDIRRRRPTDADLSTLRGLVKEGRELVARMTTLRGQLDAERDGSAALLRAREEGGGQVDPSEPRERLATLGPTLRRAAKRSEIAVAIAREERLIAEATARLDPRPASLDAMARAALPDAETVALFRQAGEQLDKAVDQARSKMETVAREQSEIELALERRVATRPVPSPEAVAAKRAKRDAAWDALRPALFGAATPPETLASRVATFERSLAEADRLADEAMTDAGRVAEHAVGTKRLAETRARRTLAADELGKAKARRQAHLHAWNAAWGPHGIEPRSPSEMSRWCEAVAALLLRRSELGAQRDRLDTITADIGFLLPELRRIATSIDLATTDEDDADRIAERLEERLKRLSAAWDQARDRETKIADVTARVKGIERRLAECDALTGAWARRWRDALPAVGLDASATPDAAEAAIQGWSEAPAALVSFDREDHRVAGMRRDNADFEARAAALIQAIARDLASLPVEAALNRMNDRAVAATSDAALRGSCLARLEEARHLAQEAAAAAEQARALLATLMTEVAPGATPDPSALLAALDAHDRLAAELADKREQFIGAADGFDESWARAELAGFDVEIAERRLAELLQAEEDLLRERESLAVKRHDASRQRDIWAQGLGAEPAAQLRRNAEAELAQAAREWAVLKLGALLLGKAIERHRAAAQNPLLERAGALFASLNAGAYAGLGSRYAEDDTAALVARRADGATVGVEGLSEGTRDQLFMALRLAYVESYAAHAEPPPFIADDLFASFDDERTGHGLAVLAGIGRSVQCILFTHHAGVVEIARRRLGAEVDIVELAGPSEIAASRRAHG